MSLERIDTVDSYFNKVTHVNIWSNFLFWFSVFCSFVVFFTSTITTLNYLINIVFIISTFLYFVISNWQSLILLRESQNRRRIHLLSDSLGIKLDDEQTNLYYNNSQNPSIIRLGVNVFENTLFTWRVTEEMVKKERAKGLVYILTLFLLLLFRGTDINLISIIAQTVFATSLIVNCIKLEILRTSCAQLNNEFRQIFLTNGLKNNKLGVATILNLVFKYETVVASMGVHLSSKTFHKINPKITAEWESIKTNVNI